MDKTQQIIINVLRDIDTVCRENDLKYFLGKNTALQAARWGHFPKNCRNATIFMPADDYESFEQLMTTSPLPNRAVESLKVNSEFPYIYMRFVDTNSTFLSLCACEKENAPGIGVSLCKLQPYNKYSRLKLSLIRAFGKARYTDVFGEIPKTPIKKINAMRIKRVERHGANAIAKLYETRLIRPGKKYEKVYVQCHYGKNLYFDKRIFESTRQITLEGMSFPIPEMIDEYLTPMHGRRWRSREYVYKEPSVNLFIDPETPFFEYLSLVKDNSSLIKDVRSLRKERYLLYIKREKARKPLDKCQHYYSRAGDRIKMARKYLPIKAELICLYKKGDFEALAIRLLDYQLVCEKYSRWNMGFAFDKELYLIICDILVWERFSATREHLLKLQKEAFDYLDNLEKTSIKEDPQPLYVYHGKDFGFERLDGTGTFVPVATVEQIELVNKHLRAMNGDYADDGSESSGETVSSFLQDALHSAGIE